MRVFGGRLALRFKWSCALALGLTYLLAGCGSSNNIIYGTPVITIGDVSGDFTSYIIDIDEITFTRSDGLIVEPLSTPEQVDLAKLTNMTELLEAPAFPYGTYTSMTLILDYSAPDISVNVDGAVQNVSALDTTGAPMLTATITVNFDPQHPLVISPNASTAFAIDIDLAAMNTVNLSAKTVTVQPFASASILPVAETGQIRARGLLVVTQPSSGYFIMNIRPFADLVSALGALTVNASDTTYFNINGNVFVGNTGLQALTSTNLTNTPAVAYGTLDDLSAITPTFNATSVYVGSSEESEIADYLTGTVSGISGDTLIVRGVSYLNRYGELTYYSGTPVQLASDTPVYEDGVAASGLTPRSISVGQQITVGGQATTDASGSLESLDATEGLVRLQPTQLWGTLNSATTGSISLDLLSIGNYEPKDYDFSGTGSDTANDAVPSSYRVDTGALNESAVPAGTLLQVNGLMTPFGAAPPDFTATSVTQASATPSTLVIEFGTNGAGVLAPWLSLSTSGMVVDLARTDSIRYIQTGPTKLELNTLPEPQTTIAFGSGTTLILAVGNYSDDVNVYNEAASFISAVHTAEDHGKLVYRLVCVGQYNAPANTFVATRVDVALEN